MQRIAWVRQRQLSYFLFDYVAVLFRVVTVYPDLKPYMQEINVSISVSVLIHYILPYGYSTSYIFNVHCMCFVFFINQLVVVSYILLCAILGQC